MDLYKTELFPYIQGESLVGKASVTLTMTSVEAEKLPNHGGQEETKYVLYFKETKKGLILNKTNAARIIALYGRETDEWAGQRISIHSEPVRAFGKNHNAVRVDEKKPKANGIPVNDPFPAAEEHPAPEADVTDMDDIFPVAPHQDGLFNDDFAAELTGTVEAETGAFSN